MIPKPGDIISYTNDVYIFGIGVEIEDKQTFMLTYVPLRKHYVLRARGIPVTEPYARI